jgi:acyl dehydratase
MEPVKEYTNVTFDEIQIGTSAEIAVTLTQNQIDLAAMVSGDVTPFI